MKVTINGKTPLEKLQNFTKRILDVSKEDITREEQRWKKKRNKRSEKT